MTGRINARTGYIIKRRTNSGRSNSKGDRDNNNFFTCKSLHFIESAKNAIATSGKPWTRRNPDIGEGYVTMPIPLAPIALKVKMYGRYKNMLIARGKLADKTAYLSDSPLLS